MSDYQNKLQNKQNMWKRLDLIFSNCNINPNPTHLPKHQTLNPDLRFSERIWYVECHSAHAHMAQNCRQKVFNRGALRFCGEALGLCGVLDILKIDKNSTDILCFMFQFGGLGALFGGLSHQKPPVATGLISHKVRNLQIRNFAWHRWFSLQRCWKTFCFVCFY